MISILTAVAENNVIGYHNKMPWHIPEDLKYFKKVTTGKTVIMGRKTYESLPGPLPGRKMIVVTRNRDFLPTPDSNLSIAADLNELLLRLKNAEEECFVIGGGEIYKQAMNWADYIYLTKIYKVCPGDAYFPEIDYSFWEITERSGIKTDGPCAVSYEFLKLKHVTRRPV